MAERPRGAYVRGVPLASASVPLAVGLLIAGCAADDAPSPLRVFAASSLTEAIDALAEDSALPVEPTYGGSQLLRLQIEEGAPADVFASADRPHVDALHRAGRVLAPIALAGNELVVVTPRDDPRVQSFADLAAIERLVVADPVVPAGQYTEALFARAAAEHGEALVARVRARIVSRESNVRGARARVEVGEADAAIVYRTDALASARLRVVELPAPLRVRADYWIAVVAASPRRAAAQRLVARATSEEGQRILSRHGFLPPR